MEGRRCLDAEVAGSNFATNWGTVGFFGPLTIHPDLWDKGLGKRLMESIMDCFDKWKTRHAGLFTSKPVEPVGRASSWTKFSDAPMKERAAILDACRELTGAIYNGLDVGREIDAVADQTSAIRFFFGMAVN